MKYIKLTQNKKVLVDIDDFDLDNRRINLRSCTASENRSNRVMSKYNTSGYRGVYWSKHTNKWCARIQINRKGIYLGLFTSKKEAAKAYDAAALEHHGEFASLNFGIAKP